MRAVLAVAMALATLSLLTAPAEARKRQHNPYAGPQYRAYGPPPPPYYGPPPVRYYQPPGYGGSDSMDCIVARDLDPGGNYAGYPCWARKALAPKRTS